LDNAQAILDVACEALGRHLNVAQVGFGDVDETETYVAIRRDWNDGRMPSAVGNWRLRKYGPQLIADLTSTRDAREAFNRISTRALLDVPLLRNGRLAALLFIHHPEPRAWTKGEIAIVEDTCRRLWAFVEKAQAEAELAESELRFRALAKASHEGVSIEHKGRIVDCNDAFWRICGCTCRDEVIGHDAREFIAPEDRALVATRVAQGFGEPYESIGLRADGIRFPVEMQGREVQFKGLPMWVSVVRDLTRQKAAELTLRESEAHFRALADAMPQLAWSTSPDGEHDYFNARCYTFSGCSPGTLNAEIWTHLIHPDDQEKYLEGWRHSLRTGEPH
jgi:PAS domain S-box-containing protein